MKRLYPLLVLGLLAACAALPPATTSDNQADVVRTSDMAWPIQRDALGRFGPDGGPLVAAPLVADRGIGGTGAPAATPAAMRTTDRGIGGTGIIGVVTGFGSVFVDGVEIQYDASAPVDIDGTRSSPAALRAGQLVAIEVEGPLTAPHARTIWVQSAVIGRIESLELGSGMLTIGGQSVSVPQGTWGANRFGLGDWVKVSGLRRADGTIEASRLDAAPAGVLSARGRVVRDGDVVRVGNLVLPEPMAAGVKDGQFVVVSGTYAAGHGRVSTVAPDTLFADPARYFGASINRLVVQAFVQVDKGSVSLNGVKVHAASVVATEARRDGIAVVSLERGADGSYTAVGLRYADYRGQANRPLRRRTGAGTGTSSQAPQRNGHLSGATAPQTDDGDVGFAANGRLATGSPTGDLDPNGALPSMLSTVTTSPTIVPIPIVPPTASVTIAPGAVPAEIKDPAASTAGSGTPVASPPAATPASSPPASPSAPSTPVSPAVPPPTGVPTVQKLPPASSPGSKSATGKTWYGTDRRGSGSSNAVTLKGSVSSPTINLLTSVTTTTNGKASSKLGTSTGSMAASSTVHGKGSTTIGTTSGKAASGNGTKPHGH
jgi:hypothetical protein